MLQLLAHVSKKATHNIYTQAGWFARMVSTFCERLGEGFHHLHTLTDGLVNRVFRGVRQEVRECSGSVFWGL